MSSLALTSCETFTARRAPIDPCPPALTAELQGEPRVPDDAELTLVLETEKQRAGAESKLEFEARHAAWGKDGWLRAGRARAWCAERGEGK